jgi:hypothetical protein
MKDIRATSDLTAQLHKAIHDHEGVMECQEANAADDSNRRQAVAEEAIDLVQGNLNRMRKVLNHIRENPSIEHWEVSPDFNYVVLDPPWTPVTRSENERFGLMAVTDLVAPVMPPGDVFAGGVKIMGDIKGDYLGTGDKVMRDKIVVNLQQQFLEVLTPKKAELEEAHRSGGVEAAVKKAIGILSVALVGGVASSLTSPEGLLAVKGALAALGIHVPI